MSDIIPPIDSSQLTLFQQATYFYAMFSKTFGYALRTATFVSIHGREGKKIGLTDLSNALDIKRCNAQHPCPLHHDFAVCRDGMIKILAEKTLGTLSVDVEAGITYLVR